MMKKYAFMLALFTASCSTVPPSDLDIERAKKWFEIFRPSPPPEQPPGEQPEPPSDEFPAGLTWLHPDVSGWPVTASLSVSVGNQIKLDYDKASVWPGRQEAGTNVNANPWVIAQVDGKWYAGTWEWMRTGQTVKNNVIRGDHVKRAPLSGDWKPQSGERVGIFVSGLIRGSTRNVSERSNVVWVVWP